MRAKPVLIALIAALSGGTLVAAEQDRRATGRVVEGSADANPELVIIDIDYPGGNVAEYLSEVGRVSGYANIVAKPGLDGLEMPSVQLRSVSVLDAIMAAESVTEQRMWVKQSGSVLVCLHRGAVFNNQPDIAPRESHVWSIQGIVESGATTDDILAAIELADAMTPGESEIKFHQTTGLVFALATQEDLKAIDRTIDTLSDSYRRSGQQSQPRELVVQYQQLEGILKESQRALADTQNRLQEERQRSASLISELDTLQTQRTAAITELQVRLEMTQQENAALQDRIKQLEAKVADRSGN